jgi:hypothetical protein
VLKEAREYRYAGRFAKKRDEDWAEEKRGERRGLRGKDQRRRIEVRASASPSQSSVLVSRLYLPPVRKRPIKICLQRPTKSPMIQMVRGFVAPANGFTQE